MLANIPQISFNPESALTGQQMAEVDRVAIEEFDLRILQMMEVAAFQGATLVREVLGDLKGKKGLIVAGKGNNGGDAVACGRFLYNWGAEVTIVAPQDGNENVTHHLALARRAGIAIERTLQSVEEPDFVVEGILGYAIEGVVRSPFNGQIEQINAYGVPVFSYDIPSGIDANNGSVHGIAVRATYTLTLAYPKKGLLAREAKPYVGELYLADIGIPDEVYKKVKQKFPEINYQNPFKEASLLYINHL